MKHQIIWIREGKPGEFQAVCTEPDYKPDTWTRYVLASWAREEVLKARNDNPQPLKTGHPSYRKYVEREPYTPEQYQEITTNLQNRLKRQQENEKSGA